VLDIYIRAQFLPLETLCIVRLDYLVYTLHSISLYIYLFTNTLTKPSLCGTAANAPALTPTPRLSATTTPLSTRSAALASKALQTKTRRWNLEGMRMVLDDLDCFLLDDEYEDALLFLLFDKDLVLHLCYCLAVTAVATDKLKGYS